MRRAPDTGREQRWWGRSTSGCVIRFGVVGRERTVETSLPEEEGGDDGEGEDEEREDERCCPAFRFRLSVAGKDWSEFSGRRGGREFVREGEREEDESRDAERRADPVNTAVQARINGRFDRGAVVVNQCERDRRGVKREGGRDGEVAEDGKEEGEASLDVERSAPSELSLRQESSCEQYSVNYGALRTANDENSPMTSPQMNPNGWPAPSDANARFLASPASKYAPSTPTPAGVLAAAPSPSSEQKAVNACQFGERATAMERAQ